MRSWLADIGPENAKLPILFPPSPKKLAPKTILWAPWSYPENLEAMTAGTPKL